MRVRLFAFAGVAGIIMSVASIFALHWLQPHMNPLSTPLSFYVYGTHGWLMTLGIAAFGLASLALGAGASLIVQGRVGPLGLSFLGIAMMVLAAFPADPWFPWEKRPTLSGAIHGLVGGAALCILPIIAFLLTRSIRTDPRWAGVAKHLLVLAFALAAICVASVVYVIVVLVSGGGPQFVGLTERIFSIVGVTWYGVFVFGMLNPARQQVLPTAILCNSHEAGC